jgi:hypothetical protein
VLRLGEEESMPWSGKNPMTVAGSIIWGVVRLEQVGGGCVCVCVLSCVCVCVCVGGQHHIWGVVSWST